MMETTQLMMQQNSENLLSSESNVQSIESNGGVEHTNGDCLPNNGDCETNKMLKSEIIEMSGSQANIRCCNGIFAQRCGGKKTKKIVKESPAPKSNGTSNGRCYFSTFKQKLTINGKHTQLIDEDLKKPTKIPVFEDRDPFKINSNLKFEFTNLFAEPNSGTYSFNPTWSFTRKVSFKLNF
jgi:hypothetical protein